MGKLITPHNTMKSNSWVRRKIGIMENDKNKSVEDAGEPQSDEGKAGEGEEDTGKEESSEESA
ncbi:hypothetical protein ES708_17896 [subsurface metagenome]